MSSPADPPAPRAPGWEAARVPVVRGLALGVPGLLLAAWLHPMAVATEEHWLLFQLTSAAAVLLVLRATLGPRLEALSDVALIVLIGVGLDLNAASGAGHLAAAAGVAAVAALVAHFAGLRVALAAGGVALLGAVATAEPALPRQVHTWNQYHYVLGTKYFAEVGYEDLYIATVLADAEGPQKFSGVRQVRDMRDYDRFLSRADMQVRAKETGLRARFSDERWAEFQHDLAVFYPLMGAKHWPSVVGDLGFNPSPVWVAIHQPLLRWVPLSADTLRMFAALQLPAYALTFGGACWAFGLRATLWIVLWNLLFFGSRGRIYGGYWSYDWLLLVLWAAIFLVRARPALAAIPVAIAGLMRGFGGLLALGPTVHAVVRLVRDRKIDVATGRFVLALGVAMALLLAFSTTAGRGTEAWGDWADKIAHHSMRISTGGRHLGLKVLFGEDWSVPGHTEDLDVRRQVYAGQSWAYHLCAGLLGVWTLWVARRRPVLDAALLGLIPAFGFMVLSRYYYAAWSVLFLLGTREGDRAARLPVSLGLFGVLMLHEGLFSVEGTTPDGRHQDVNLYLLLLAVVTLGYYTVVDLRGKKQLVVESTPA